ncbi:hypothetical protein JW897_06460 [Chromobacterium alkanivorans]|uniref:hypothetical protein n=1 Tax=Chromobacterium alkanivorans TaxID=1071719 RepID=UPI001967E600|nr:hypothetical protein [Chromobacterium alkanivorans]MBN3003378.1 hypothetical protein [Chromobacterium alkanivorans]
MKPELLKILQHTVGVNEYGLGEQYRNHYAAGGDDVTRCRELVSAGLMREHPASEMTGGSPWFAVTAAGLAAITQHSPRQTRPDNAAWSANGETFNYEDFADLAISEELRTGDIVYYGTRQPLDPANRINIDDVLERLGDGAHEAVGEVSDVYPDPSKEAQEELHTLLSEWARKHCPPAFYLVEDITEYTVTEEDLKESLL